MKNKAKDELNALGILQYKTGRTLTVDWEAKIGSDQCSSTLGPRRHHHRFQYLDSCALISPQCLSSGMYDEGTGGDVLTC